MQDEELSREEKRGFRGWQTHLKLPRDVVHFIYLNIKIFSNLNDWSMVKIKIKKNTALACVPSG